MKGIWGKTAKCLLAAFGAAGVALVGYVVEHGEFPAWLSELIGLVKGGLTATTSWATWELLLPTFAIGGISIILLIGEAAKIKKQDDHITALTNKLESAKSNLRDTEKSRSELKAIHDELIRSYATLEASCTELHADNERLKNSCSSPLQAARPDKLNASKLNSEQLFVFRFIGERIDSGHEVTVDTVVRELRLSLLTAEDILDTLCELGLIERHDNLFEAESFYPTTGGRSCYLELKRNASIKPATRHG